MKNFFLSMMAFVSVLSLSACADSSSSQDLAAKDHLETGTAAMKDFGKTIPVGIEEEGNGNLRVSFILRAQFFTIRPTKDNESSVEMIRQAVKNETPIHVFIKSGTTEIAKVEKVNEEDLRYFKSLLTKEVRTEANKLATVLPNVTTLNTMFTLIKNQACGTSTASSPCITFRYPVDGCYARAHKMRQILTSNGYDCEKQFVYGNLRASTGTCCVRWNYHVAVLVSYKNASGVIEKRIFDPSLFPAGPVTEAAWRAACTNSTCGSVSVSSYANTAGDVYYRSPAGSMMYDDSYSDTNCTLTTFAPLSGCSPSPAPNTNCF